MTQKQTSRSAFDNIATEVAKQTFIEKIHRKTTATTMDNKTTTTSLITEIFKSNTNIAIYKRIEWQHQVAT